jgi:chlorite dismutase/heme-degrading monooxygenase HmoA
MPQRDPPPTDEGWYALHDCRTIDWDAWANAPERRRRAAIDEGVAHLQSHVAVEDVAERRSAGNQTESGDAEEGQSALYSVVGHKADLMIVHLRPTIADLETAERRFERTALAEFTEQSYSYLSVTEASGYTEKAREYFEGEVDEDSGLHQYIQDRLHPDIPDAEHVCFYPMSKRRDPEQNWYDLPFDDRAEHMSRHGDLGRGYAGKVNQMIAGSVGFDDWEWGITLWADDPTDIKDLLYEMRFDPSSSKFAEFGPFYFGRRFPPADLGAYLAGERVPADDAEGATADAGAGAAPSPRGGTSDDAGHAAGGDTGTHGGAHPGSASQGDHPHGDDDQPEDAEGADSEHGTDPDHGGDDHDDAEERDVSVQSDDDIQQKLATLGIYPGNDYEEGAVGIVLYSEADAEALADEVDGLRGNFEHYDTHVMTTVRANEGRAAIVSVWDTESAAETASGFLNDLSGVVEGYRGRLGEGDGDAEATDAADAEADAESIREELADLDVYAGKPHGEDVYALVLYSEADTEELFAEVDDLRDGFDRYDTHQGTKVYEARGDGPAAVVSLWDTESAADTASDFLTDLPGIVGRAGDEDGFGTMGMFYTVEPAHREDFVEKFDTVGEVLAEMDGHHGTDLLVNHENENDMFIASLWASKEDAMGFFRSDDFADTVDWGRDVLADRPRHVFLA